MSKLPLYELCEELVRLFKLNAKPNAYIQFYLDEVLNYAIKNNNNLSTILLDDAFQHRYVTPSLSIALTDYFNLYVDDYMLPTGTLREFNSGIKRADIIIVTKCPHKLVSVERKSIKEKLNALPHQQIFFSTIKYGDIIPLSGPSNGQEDFFKENYSILLFSGIANTSHLEEYLKRKAYKVNSITFPDHYDFTEKDINHIANDFSDIVSSKKIIITTEKDLMRLKKPEIEALTNKLPIFYIPIEIVFNEEDRSIFDTSVLQHIENFNK
jgi:tetraacyldisaccharide 4'-kinase